MPQQLFQHALPNGLTLLGERMDHVRSAAMYLLVPSGYAYDPPDRLGTATVLAELLTRGAGDRDSVRLALDLDNLGTDRGESVGPFNVILSAGTLARNLPAVLDIYADVVRRPHLPDDELEPAQQLALQDILGLEDSPHEKAMLELKARFYPPPLGRSRYGTADGVKALTSERMRDHYGRRFRANGAILSVAGAIDWPKLVEQAERLFGDWPGGADPEPTPGPHAPASGHVHKEMEGTHVALAIPSVPLTDPDYYAARGAAWVLSGGMSSRLFTEVREKRGLCYTVYATHDFARRTAALLGFADPPADKAQETLDVLVAEFRRLSDGISDDEVARVRALLKTATVMQEESPAARAGSMASDWFNLGRVRPVDEVQAAIDGLTPAGILGYLDRYPVKDLTVVTLGPKPLSLPS